MEDTDTAIIFDIQRFSLHDGPGIRTTVFFKGCPLRCAWCQNPESWHAKPEIAFYKDQCRGCFDCLPACQENAILKGADRRIDFDCCTGCGACAAACIQKALRLVGRVWTVAELVDELVRDGDYFEESGGGVTLSGGEPMQQAGFLSGLLPELKRRHIHITVETCGQFSWGPVENLLPFLDLILFDLKAMNPDVHAVLTGCSNKTILKNFVKLAGVFPGLYARMPVIPTMNDTRRNIVETAEFLLENGRDSICLLPYHNLGEAKISSLNADQKPLGIKSQAPHDLDRVKDLFEAHGVEATINA